MSTAAKPTKLSKRQKQLMEMLDQGLSNKVIADKLQIAEHTVKCHLWRMYQRIGVKSRTQAVKWWHDNQPTGMPHALRAAFEAACRMADKLKAGEDIDLGEFEHHRAAVTQMQGAPA